VIIFRYLARNLIANTLAVTAVLMLVVVSGRFVKYLADAAAGRLDASVLLALLVYRLPGFFELVLPLAFFISILLAYGQLYVENEMTVLQACGMSYKRLMSYTLAVAGLVALVVASFSLYVSPSGFDRMDKLINAQWQRGEIETLSAGKFYSLRANRGVTYSEEISKDGVLTNVFLAQQGDRADTRGMVIVVADHGYSRKSDKTGESYLVLREGHRIQGVPGQGDFQVTSFDEFGQRLEPMRIGERVEVDAIPTNALWGATDPQYQATLHWRLSLPVMVMIVSLLAVPLSKTNPRQGRFNKILPAVILYVVYLLTLNSARGAIEDESSLAEVLMPLIHVLFLAVALVIMGFTYGWKRSNQEKGRTTP
jgi:lipopolysaccharide export system permease protein